MLARKHQHQPCQYHQHTSSGLHFEVRLRPNIASPW